ncbi:hypothetical protein [Cohnella sp. OV330]|uniref:hypothetical protein n=1 Tax=Cohnella sp. OV330 TaxID=1855288 RepID=UPI002101C9A3|nr:hypothetical protein [Cohnella sp. OV330]
MNKLGNHLIVGRARHWSDPYVLGQTVSRIREFLYDGRQAFIFERLGETNQLLLRIEFDRFARFNRLYGDRADLYEAEAKPGKPALGGS